jgi:hypothetical protein
VIFRIKKSQRKGEEASPRPKGRGQSIMDWKL